MFVNSVNLLTCCKNITEVNHKNTSNFSSITIDKPSIKIAFGGLGKNPNQIAVLAAECVPYCVSGGLGSVTADMTKSYKLAYPQKDLRLFLPFYNATANGPQRCDNKDVYLATPDNFSNIFEVEDINLSASVEHGVKNETAKLFKIKSPINGVTTYLVYVPAFVDFNKQYMADDFSLFEKYSAFSYATVKLLEKMKNSKENFNPKILHTNDWHTVFANFASNDKDLKRVHELLNANSNFHGKVTPLAAALNIFNNSQIEKLLSNSTFKRELYQLAVKNKNILLNNVTYNDLNADINNQSVSKKILYNLANNYKNVLYLPENYYSHIELNKIVRNALPEINWDENNDFNPTINAINEVDAWYTISKTHLNELLTDYKFSSLGLYNMMRLNLNKGTAVLNKIDTDRYNPSNPAQVQFPYDISTYKEGKKNNKEYLFNEFGNPGSITYDTQLIPDRNSAKVYGYLDSSNSDMPLVVNISRFDKNQKGSDIVLKAIESLLNKQENLNVILVLPDFHKLDSELMKEFIANVVEKPENQGRIVLIDAYVPINKYLAGADFSIIPSRSETCGLVGYQSMRMGALPISTPVGSMNDCLITPQENLHKATGFKTPAHFFKDCLYPEVILENTIKEALLLQSCNRNQIDRMIKNAMSFNSDWSSAIKEQQAVYEKLLANRTMNNKTLNDLRNVEDIVKIKMYNQNDIDKLKETDVLVVLPHSDDEIFFLPMLSALDRGMSVQVIYSSANEKGHHKEGAPSTANELAKHRRNESLESLNALGITLNPLQLNIPDLELAYNNNPQLMSDYLKRILQRVKPKVVLSFGPDGLTGNPDHKKLGEIVFNCVKNYRQKYAANTEVYQIGISESNLYEFKNIMSNAKTDAFDFVSSVPDSQIVKKYDLTKYLPQIKSSLEKHKSQWSKDEAECLLKYYAKNGAEITRLTKYPEITNPRNPWKDRNEHFSNLYGKEFRTNGTEIFFTPESSNVTFNLYLSNFGYDTERLWLENECFTPENIKNSPNIPELALSQIYKIKKIPKFENIKYIDIPIYPDYAINKLKLVIPYSEVQDFAPYVKYVCKNGKCALNTYKDKHPYSDIEIKEIE